MYPLTVIDTNVLRGSSFPEGTIQSEVLVTTTELRFDQAGNVIRTTVTTDNKSSNRTTEKYKRETINTYGVPGSSEAILGKLTHSVTSAQKLFPLDGHNDRIEHITDFEYDVTTIADPWSFILHGYYPLALVKKKIEPGSPAAKHLELHTVFEYDRFGNVITTTSCDTAFDQCKPGATGPEGELGTVFRTTRVSFDPADFNAPSGTDLLTDLTYGAGRFPVMATNAVGHKEYTAYDPLSGLKIQQTGPNGIHTCFKFDEVGRQTSTISRCGSSDPLAPELTTTVSQHLSVPEDPYRPALAGYVTVTQPPTGTPTWVYADALGRTLATLTRAFGGEFSESLTNYDTLGRLASSSKPFVPGDTVYWTTPGYDPLGRVTSVTQDLAAIDGTSNNTTTVVTTVHEAHTTATKQTVNQEPQPRQRTEVKNALGKAAQVIDARGKTMSYIYDAEGNLTDTGDPTNDPNNVVHSEYDSRGRKTLTRDPDLGQWTYEYNGFGDLVKQTDAKGQVTTMFYDHIGRMLQKEDGSGNTTVWGYDFGPGGVGKLIAAVAPGDPKFSGECDIPDMTEVPGKFSGRWYKYTPWGEVSEAFECIDGETFSTQYVYDTFGRQQTVRYPGVKGTRLSIDYHYTNQGYLHYLTDEADGSVYWATTATNAAGQVTAEYTRNGVKTLSTRNPATGWLTASSSTAQADNDTLIQSWAYHFDERGNLRWRGRNDKVNTVDSEETFGYDELDRLTSSEVKVLSPQISTTTETYEYDALGSITKKGAKVYTYGDCGAGPHAVCGIVGGTTYGYDANGNMVSGGDRDITYNPVNKVTSIYSHPATSQGNDTGIVEFIYGLGDRRVVQKVADGDGNALARTVYVGMDGTGKTLYEKTTKGTTVEHVQFLYAGDAHGGRAFALRELTDNGASTMQEATKYYHFDHLGSVTAMSDESGHVIGPAYADAGVLGYDAWGARRSPEGRTAAPASFNLQVGHREFTGHEAIPNVGLVNMNGRVYDPQLGRFLSPDPSVQFSADLQSYNRYSYVLNNPLRYADPTGYFLGISDSLFTNIFIGVLGVAACTVGGPAACIAFAAAMILINGKRSGNGVG